MFSNEKQPVENITLILQPVMCLNKIWPNIH